MEYQIIDRLSFMRFLDMVLDSRVPDAKTIWLFRSKLEEHKLTRKLFDKFYAFLAKSGFDAPRNVIPAMKTRRSKKEIAPETWSEAKKRQKDTNARWVQKKGKNYYGYKNHVGADVKYKIIRNYKVTDASVHDGNVFEERLYENNTSKDVYADSTYRSGEKEASLKKGRLRAHLQRKDTMYR